MTGKKLAIIIITLVFIITAGGGVYYYLKSKPDYSTEEIPPQPGVTIHKKGQYKIASWQDLEQIEAPSSYQIQGIQYDDGGFDCCLCAGIVAQYEYVGMKDYKDLLSEIAPPATSRNMDAMMEVLQDYGLERVFYMGYYYKGQEKETRSEMQQFFEKHLAETKEQIKLFADEREAYNTLRKLVSLNIPVIVAWEENQTLQPMPQNEIQDNTFNLIIGYDDNKLTYYTLPNLKTTVSVDEFKEKKWNLQDTVFQYPVIPGNYTMIFLMEKWVFLP